MAKLRVRQAVLAALDHAMAADPNVILLGEDIGAAGGAFKCTEGLLERYGPQRVIDTPISELGFLGAGVGAAANGLRPVVEMMFVEFIGAALDQLTTEAATLRYLSRGTWTAPLVVRASVGGGQGFGCQHSQVLDQWFRGVPGLTVCMPSDGRTAYGLLRAAIDHPDPVVVLEPRILYGDREEVDLVRARDVKLGTAEVARPGGDVTVVAAGAFVSRVTQAADVAKADIEVIDLLTLSPWDAETIAESLNRTGRLVTVEESTEGAGWGGDVIARMASEHFGDFRSPPLRITLPHAPIPYSGSLETAYFPDPTIIAAQIDHLVFTDTTPSSWWKEAS